MIRYEQAVRSKLSIKLGEDADFQIGPFGSSFTTDNYTEDRSFRYIRGKDVKPLMLMENDNVYMPESDYRRLGKYALREDDILISVVGTLGNSAIVSEKNLPAIFSCKSTVVRPRSLDPRYLTVYLNCEYGRTLLVRKERGVIQTGLNLDDLRDLPVFQPSITLQLRIAQIFELALQAVALSKTSLVEAETLLLDALGLRDWSPPEPLAYTRTAADAIAAGRLDPQYYMPAKTDMIEALASLPGTPLGEAVAVIRDLVDPRRDPAGRCRNYDLTDALQPVLDGTKPVGTFADMESQKMLLADGDLAVARLRSYLREIAVVRIVDEIPSVGSSEFYVLRHRPGGRSISAEALMVFLRAPPVQTILKWCQDGSQHPRFAERDLLAIPLPDAVVALDVALKAKVHAALDARSRSLALLEAAKRAVEIAIEDSEAAALAYIAAQDAA